MLKVAIIGASGYTGAELCRLLCNHSGIKLSAVTSRQFEGKKLSEIFPHLRGKTDLVCHNYAIDEITSLADFIFCAVPHKTAMDLVPPLLDAGKKVVDLSADFRLKNVDTYQQWYQEHSSPHLLKDAVYGLPERYRDEIKHATLVANPGCYPTSVILALAPLLDQNLIDPQSIIIDAKSGTSGAGRSIGLGTLFCEVHDGFKPYKVGGTHRHTPEIEQELSQIAASGITVSFTPHLLPISRGILSTIYCSMALKAERAHLNELYTSFYRDEPFVRVLDEGGQPATQFVRGSNFCDIGIEVDRRTNRLIITAAIDNIVKGASGQAIQNMNLMAGFDESEGISNAPFFP
ncbi:MAG: N-acetyl-gamma-glutamyl-phosphate reductase [Desulfobulbaceae bacterium]|nr:MAG: N-acetyl-gamma-glutamyl-phosphate reductase [Desulfobulbaceae bacterium]